MTEQDVEHLEADVPSGTLLQNNGAPGLTPGSSLGTINDEAPFTEPTVEKLDEERAHDKRLQFVPEALGADELFWPANDADSPEYAHLLGPEAAGSFAITSDHVERLI